MNHASIPHHALQLLLLLRKMIFFSEYFKGFLFGYSLCSFIVIYIDMNVAL